MSKIFIFLVLCLFVITSCKEKDKGGIAPSDKPIKKITKEEKNNNNENGTVTEGGGNPVVPVEVYDEVYLANMEGSYAGRYFKSILHGHKNCSVLVSKAANNGNPFFATFDIASEYEEKGSFQCSSPLEEIFAKLEEKDYFDLACAMVEDPEDEAFEEVHELNLKNTFRLRLFINEDDELVRTELSRKPKKGIKIRKKILHCKDLIK